jgi:sarcosine oxidase subunit gamma
MVDPRHSPLDDLAQRLAHVAVSTAGRLRIEQRRYARQLSVRTHAAAVGKACAALGVALPTTPNTVSRVGDVIALWLGPDEWLVLAVPDQAAGEVATTAGWACVDVSAQRVAIVLSGPEAVGLLAFGCALDIDRARPGWCFQTMLARAPVVLFHGPPDEVTILVRRSFAPYLATWLLDAASGIRPAPA